MLKISRFIYDKNIKYMLLITVMFYLPMCIITALLPQYLREAFISTADFFSKLSEADSATYAAAINSFDSKVFDDTMIYLLLNKAISVFFMPLAMGAATYITWQTIGGKDVNISGILDASVGKIGKYILTSVVLYAILFFSCFLILPGIFFAVAFYFWGNAVAHTDQWGFGALKKSFSVISGRWFKTLFFIIMVFLLQLLVKFVFSSFNTGVLDVILNMLGLHLCLWFVVAVCVKYLNLDALAARKEEEIKADHD